jgi:hydrogenase-1 operon protein HyaE
MSPIEALTGKYGFAAVDEHTIDEFLSAQAGAVLFFPGDSERLAESADVAVILPELLKQFPLTPAIVDKSAERALQRRFRFNAFPALVFLRGPGYLGAVTQVHNWREYVDEITAILAREPSEPPPFKLPDGCAVPLNGGAHTHPHSGDHP